MARTCFPACSLALAAAMLLPATRADALTVNYDFSIAYSGMTIRGTLVGLQLDAAGNASEADPVRVLLTQVPAIVGLQASVAHPYVFDPYWYGRMTIGGGQQATTTPGLFGFRVQQFQIVPGQQSLLLSDPGYDVFMEFNYGTVFSGINWGMAAEENAIWPAQDTRVTFTLASAVPEPPTGALASLGALVLLPMVMRRRQNPSPS